jgi:uncharacterized protein
MGIFCYDFRMKQLSTLITILFISLLTSPSWSETVSGDELVVNPTNGLVYKKFTTDLFTGSTTPTSNNPSKGSYKNGKKDGFWETFYENGLLRTKGNFKDGKQDGIWEEYNTNGKLEYKNSYKDGDKITGVFRTYSENGDLCKKETYKNGKLNGPFENWKLGGDCDFLFEKGNFKDGKLDGILEQYHHSGNGRLSGRVTVKDGEPDPNGFMEEYYTNGKLKLNIIIKDNIYEVEEYYENGILKTKGTYKDNKEDGIWEYFNEDGSLQRTETYKNGVKQ